MDETWCTDVTSQEVIKKYVIKSWGHRARFHVTMLWNHDGYLGPFWTARSPKLDKKERFFWWCVWNLTWMYCLSTYVPEKCLLMPLLLIWILAVRPVMAQSVHFNKIAKKQNIDFMPIFFSLKGSTVLTKIMKQKVGVSVLVFAVELQKVLTKCISLRWD